MGKAIDTKHACSAKPKGSTLVAQWLQPTAYTCNFHGLIPSVGLVFGMFYDPFSRHSQI